MYVISTAIKFLKFIIIGNHMDFKMLLRLRSQGNGRVLTRTVFTRRPNEL